MLIGKSLFVLGAMVMALGMFCLGHTLWSAHTTGSYLSDEVFLWQGRSFIVVPGYLMAMAGCLIYKAFLRQRARSNHER